jgi:prepilin signal peptidase PulO-like enzyme (type II secretory pathway)
MGYLPEPFAIFMVFILGLILGSFLTVVATRFHTGKSINGRSRCMSCGHTLSWYELFPLISYVALRGRCMQCGAAIPARLFLMEVFTGLLFVYVYVNAASLLMLLGGLVLVSLLVVIALYDIDHMIIPHEFVVALLIFSSLFLLISSRFSLDLTFYAAHILTGCGVALFYGGLWLISKGRWIGLGDSKLAFPLGLLLTPAGAFSMIVLSFWVGAGISVGILLWQRLSYSGKHRLPISHAPLTMKSEVPFAPFMIAAFALVFFQQFDVLSLMASLF